MMARAAAAAALSQGFGFGVRGYAAGGVDYISKPCHLSEFLARVRTHIRLYHLLQEVARLEDVAIDANPLTHLPGNNTIMNFAPALIATRSDIDRIVGAVKKALEKY